MVGNSKRRIGALAVTGMVIAGVAAFSSMSASGADPQPATRPVLIKYGTVTLNLTSGTERYEFKPAVGDVVFDKITPIQPCATVDAGAGDYLRVSPTSPTSDTVQIRNDAFGVNTGNTSCGSSSAAVISGNEGELLKFQLAPALVTAKVYIKSANLKLTRVKSGNPTYQLDSDTAVSKGFAPEIGVTPTINTVADLFTSITISSDSKKSNEGISIASGTTFDLVTVSDSETAVFCNQYVTKLGATGDIATSATYERLDNKNLEACDDVGVQVEIQKAGGSIPEDSVFWNNQVTGLNTGSLQRVQAYFTIVWAGTKDANDLNREIDYDAGGTAAGPVPMMWCTEKDANGIPNLPAYDGPGSIEYTPADNTPDLRAPWCLVQDDRALQADGNIVQTQKLFGSGDPWAR